MKKTILIISPDASSGQPVFERTDSFRRFFEEEGYRCELHRSPRSISDLVRLMQRIYTERWKFIFVTMPPFRNWWLCFLPGVRILLDFRDGWSVAMKTGYGGTAKPKKILWRVARAIEQVAILRSTLTIACTPGLLRYHTTKFSASKLAFVPNGFSMTDAELVEGLNSRKSPPQDPRKLIFICAGKFCEYGPNKVQDIVDIIHDRYHERSCTIKVFTRNKPENVRAVKSLSVPSGIDIEIFDAIPKKELYEQILLSDCAISVLRDSEYDFGTKIFDYILCGTPVLHCFHPGDFTAFFKHVFDIDYEEASIDKMYFSREDAIGRCQELRIAVGGDL